MAYIGPNKTVLAILAGSTLIAAALYLRPMPGRYEFRAENGLARLDTATGEMVVCNNGRCAKVDRQGNLVNPATEPVSSTAPPASISDGWIIETGNSEADNITLAELEAQGRQTEKETKEGLRAAARSLFGPPASETASKR